MRHTIEPIYVLGAYST